MVKLSDYGMTHGESTDGKLNTVLYQPLEVFEGKREMKSDVWSLGISLIEMVRGENPYDGTNADYIQGSVNINESPFLSSSERSAAFVDFLSKCLVKDVKERWSVSELLRVGECEGDDE